jgi:hypothetical protein
MLHIESKNAFASRFPSTIDVQQVIYSASSPTVLRTTVDRISVFGRREGHHLEH